jgi:L-arabinose isomerase
MNTRVRFAADDPASMLERWVAAGPTHHLAIAPGRWNGVIEKLARMANARHVIID